MTLTENSSVVTNGTQGPQKYPHHWNSCRDALPCMKMALKLPWYFYQLMEKPLGRYFQVRSPYYQAAQCNQKTPIPVSSRWQVRSEKARKGKASTLITATTSVHLPRSVWTDLTIKPDSVLTNPILQFQLPNYFDLC